MRVLLIQAFTALDMDLVYPIGLAYLAAHLDGHEVDIFDLNLYRDEPFEGLERKLNAFQPEVVGISLRNMFNMLTQSGDVLVFRVGVVHGEEDEAAVAL